MRQHNDTHSTTVERALFHDKRVLKWECFGFGSEQLTFVVIPY